MHLDPFYYMLKMFLPPENEWGLPLKALIFFVRVFVITVCAFEGSRFGTLHIFVFLSIILTMSTCLQQLYRNFIKSETKTFKLYNMSRVVMNATDYFTRHVMAHSLAFGQLFIV